MDLYRLLMKEPEPAWLTELGVTTEEYEDFLRCQGEYALRHSAWETTLVGNVEIHCFKRG